MESNEQHWKTVDEAIDWIHSLLTLGIKPGLKRMEWMLERFGNPERRTKFIHIGGTNGKGSTLSFMRHVLEDAGFEVGTFTSPFIERFQNRIQINGQDIPDQDLLELTKKVKPLADELASTELGSPTEFEVVTMIAILYFSTVAYPDYVLWEVGLGGRLDSTNVVVPIASIITNVGFDHIHILGEKIEEIAFEKAGIIKSGVPVITGTQNEQALAVIKEKAKEKKATLYSLPSSFRFQEKEFSEEEQRFSYQSMFSEWEDLVISMKGKHQLENAAVAIMALEVLKQYYAIIWEEENLRAGLQKTSWMGRLEKIKDVPLTYLDGAHNPEGMKALTETIKMYYGARPVTVLFSAMKDKDILPMLTSLDEVADRIILTYFPFPRTATVEELMKQVQDKTDWRMEIRGEESWEKAYSEVISTAQEDEVIFITGSLYFISEVRQKLVELKA